MNLLSKVTLLACSANIFFSKMMTLAEASHLVGPEFMRSLQQDDSSSYLKYDNCLVVKTKVAQTVSSGSSGNNKSTKYVEQNVPYVAYRQCSGSGCSKSSLIVSLNSVIGNLISDVKTYCGSCTNDCSSCSGITNENNQYDETDETQAIYCTPAYYDETNHQYYRKATCDGNGGLTIAVFSDSQCSNQIQDSTYSSKFSYNYFNAIKNLNMNCDDGDCYAEKNMSLECVNGKNINSDFSDTTNVCKSYYEKEKETMNDEEEVDENGEKKKKTSRTNSGSLRPGFSGSSSVTGTILLVIVAMTALGGLAYVGYKHAMQYLAERETERIVTGEIGERKDGEYAVMT